MIQSNSREPHAPARNSSSELPLYPRLLGATWTQLDERVRHAHLDGERLCLAGTFRVRHGTNKFARLLATILRLPSAGDAVAVRLNVLPTESGEKWIRTIGRSTLITSQKFDEAGIFRERLGAIEFRIRMDATNGRIVYHQVGAALRLAFLAIPLPRWLGPRVESFEEAGNPDGTHVSVRVTLPLVGLLLSYVGRVAREEPK